MSCSVGEAVRKYGDEGCDRACRAVELKAGAQSESLDVIWKAKGGDLSGTFLLAGASRSTESMFWYKRLCLLGSYPALWSRRIAYVYEGGGGVRGGCGGGYIYVKRRRGVGVRWTANYGRRRTTTLARVDLFLAQEMSDACLGLRREPNHQAEKAMTKAQCPPRHFPPASKKLRLSLWSLQIPA
ncbi:hypothetical protein AUEXF2481DRAFT_608602 [Aureobasidium subglaciale EXF-2481]|uniref:Uncharacterized protein n=1 Tax=Aureobasidium subglaciale (strain EXF-2481) TaxID=1043005 RepID=A0A074YG70_AURSE|nr:uncharacterized protein AUEXF2481DRAFT_608602 [Aureobasidium subglaciale EXF-2481]KEQ96710.1 hypothetical protein AUEXF2481DRAFT_608602 [Aureobasidium subglaciale EXF-2481]